MEFSEQTALDYLLGVLPREDSNSFEESLETDPNTLQLYLQAQDDCANLSLSAVPQVTSSDLRSRILQVSSQPFELTPLFDTSIITNLCDAYNSGSTRYTGGGVSSSLADVSDSYRRDTLPADYQNLLQLFNLVSGASSASMGINDELEEWIRSNSSSGPVFNTPSQTSDLSVDNPSLQSISRTYLSAFPSLYYFLEKISSKSSTVADVRRLFYLCRDQLKIMRASFRDLDYDRLVEDEKLMLHGAGLLRSKWWGANHTFFSPANRVMCGNFFDGPVTERCVEFAEYDSNLYCLANLLSPRSVDSQFHIETVKDILPDGVLAVCSAKTTSSAHDDISDIIDGRPSPNVPSRDAHLWNLVSQSVQRAHQHISGDEVKSQKFLGCYRQDSFTHVWFSWPAILSQDGADASTGKPSL